MDFDTYLDNNMNDLAQEKFNQLSRFYKSTDGIRRYTNIEDSIQSIKQVEWIAIAELLKEGKVAAVGCALQEALMRVCTNQAEEELEEDYERNVADGQAEKEYQADMAYERMRDRKMGL